MIFDELISSIADFEQGVKRVFKALAEYKKMSSEDLFAEGYTPPEYAQRKCKREIIREIFRPGARKYFRAFPCSRSVPGMVRKRGRMVKRGGIG